MKVERLRIIEQEIACGTTAVVALIYNNRLFVTNVGNSRAVLCTTDSNGRLHVQQVSISLKIFRPFVLYEGEEW